MAFFDKLGKKFENMVQDAHEYTTDFIEINRLNGSIRAEREAIDALHRKIGVTMHKRFQDGEAVPEDVRADLEEITSRQEKIAGLEAKVEETRRQDRSVQAAEAGRASEPVPAAGAVPMEADTRPAGQDGDQAGNQAGDLAGNAITIDVPMESEMSGMSGGMAREPLSADDTLETRQPLRADDTLEARQPLRADETPDTGGAAGAVAPTEADIVKGQAESSMTSNPEAQQDAGQAVRPTRRFCTNCGSPLTPGKPFCGNCGQRND